MKKSTMLFLLLLAPTYQLVAAQPRPKRGVGRRRPGRGVPPKHVSEHLTAQQEFAGLRKALGISTSAAIMASMRPVTGQKANQAQFNSIRLALNKLLSKEILIDSDIQAIEQKIAELKRLKPSRWPRAEDYEEVLNLRK